MDSSFWQFDLLLIASTRVCSCHFMNVEGVCGVSGSWLRHLFLQGSSASLNLGLKYQVRGGEGRSGKGIKARGRRGGGGGGDQQKGRVVSL